MFIAGRMLAAQAEAGTDLLKTMGHPEPIWDEMRRRWGGDEETMGHPEIIWDEMRRRWGGDEETMGHPDLRRD
jgi:hypothetical protein